MLGKGLLARERSNEDGRANTVSLTDKGRTALAEAEPRAHAADQAILKLAPSSKRSAFMACLRALAAERPKDGEEKADKGKKAKKAKKKAAKKAKKSRKPEGEPALVVG